MGGKELRRHGGKGAKELGGMWRQEEPGEQVGCLCCG